MSKSNNLSVAITVIILSAAAIFPLGLGAAPSFPLTMKENGIDGTIEMSNVGKKTSKIRLLDKNNREVEKHLLAGCNARLDQINGNWPNGPIFLATSEFIPTMGSFGGPYSKPFQVIRGHIQWAKVQKSIHQKSESILLSRTLKTEWVVRRVRDNSRVEILEIKCLSDVDYAKKNSDEMKFERIFTRYSFDGRQWLRFTRNEDGCWETGDTFPNRQAFP